MDDRPVWRPNSIELTDWNKLSREEQISWWKRKQLTSSPHPLRAVVLYEKGVVTAMEVPVFVFENLTESNVQEFMLTSPSHILDMLRDAADRLPADEDDEGWGECRRIDGVSYAPWVSIEEIELQSECRDRQFRYGLRVFREAQFSSS